MGNRVTYALLDARLIEDTHLLARFVEAPKLKTPGPVVAPGQMYGSVLREPSGLWKMWYLNGRQPVSGMADIFYRMCYATSSDGVHWEKPDLNLIDAPDGLSPNNAFLDCYSYDGNGADLTGSGGAEGMCIFDAEITPHPAARGRYTAFYRASPSDRIGGNLAAYSDDGLRWTAYPENPIVPAISDNTYSVFYDARLGQYVMYGRMWGIIAGREANATRKIARQVSDDLVHWSTPRIVLDTDDGDAPPLPTFAETGLTVSGQLPTICRGRDKQFYLATMWPEHDLTMALAAIFDTEPGTLSVELMHSYDGIDWRREVSRPVYIGAGAPTDMEGAMFIPALSPPVLHGDEHYIYASQTPVRHYAELTYDERVTRETKIMLLTTPRDRWVGYAAGAVEGELVTAPLPWEAGKLTLNARVERGGYLQVSFDDELGIPLRDWHLDEIHRLEGPLDAVDIPLTFGPDIGAGPKQVLRFPTRGPVRLRVKLKNAALFGFGWES